MNSIIKLVVLTLFTLLATGAWAELDVYKIWNGEYDKVRNKVQKFVAEKDTSRGWSNVYEKTWLLSFVGRHAAISRDVSTLNWAQNQLFEKYREVELDAISSFQNYKNAIAKTIASESEKKSSLLALNGIKKEAEFGIRTVLEELDAEVEYLNASANLIKSEAEKVYNLLSIKAILGELTIKVIDSEYIDNFNLKDKDLNFNILDMKMFN